MFQETTWSTQGQPEGESRLEQLAWLSRYPTLKKALEEQAFLNRVEKELVALLDKLRATASIVCIHHTNFDESKLHFGLCKTGEDHETTDCLRYLSRYESEEYRSDAKKRALKHWTQKLQSVSYTTKQLPHTY